MKEDLKDYMKLILRENDDVKLSDLGIDSLTIVDIVINIEKDYNITVSDDKLSHIKTVGDVKQLIPQ